jgi:hypothetical protein
MSAANFGELGLRELVAATVQVVVVMASLAGVDLSVLGKVKGVPRRLQQGSRQAGLEGFFPAMETL